MKNKFNSASKNIIRLYWGKKLLEFFQNNLKKKLFYLGLPAPEALDIMAWLDHLEQVYAFQCRDYNLRTDQTENRDQILRLEENLRELERKKILKNYEIFEGFLEEVVLRGKDFSPNEKIFNHSDIVTVYNLDFCNSITSPLEILNDENELIKVYKFEAIKKLLEYQSKLKESKKFILFLTIHASYDGGELSEFLSSTHSEELKNYLESVKKISSNNERRFRVVKSFVYDNLVNTFRHFNFLAEFLPTIYYTGSGNNRLLHFTVIGTSVKNTAGSSTPLQNMKKLLNQKCLVPDKNAFQMLTNKDFKENDVTVNPISVFKQSVTFKKYWNK